MRLKVGVVVAAILAFGAQNVVASAPDGAVTEQSSSTTSSEPATTSQPTTESSTTAANVPNPKPDADAPSIQANSTRNEGPSGNVGQPGNRGGQVQVVPTPAPPPPPPTLPPHLILPADSGNGRRVIYHKTRQRVWLVDENNNIVKTHLVSGRLTWNQPSPGTYRVFSRSIYTCSVGNSSVCWRYMVRFTYGPGGLAIGFHEIPTNLRTGAKLQTVAQLGTPRSAGCVRQAPWDAKFMWDWAGIGTPVVVIQ